MRVIILFPAVLLALVMVLVDSKHDLDDQDYLDDPHTVDAHDYVDENKLRMTINKF